MIVCINSALLLDVTLIVHVIVEFAESSETDTISRWRQLLVTVNIVMVRVRQ